MLGLPGGALRFLLRVTTVQIEQIPVLNDNYVYLIHDEATGMTAAVDPAVAQPVLDRLRDKGWNLTHILNTHHHYDHVGGNEDLIRATGCKVVGSANDAARIPGIGEKVADGDTISVGSLTAKVFDVPGHTSGHIAYWFEEGAALFCGDTLFALGCGRLFEGTPKQMWASLLKLRALPDDTKVYCAHEYTQSNAAFALSVEPDCSALVARSAEINALRSQGQPTVPSTIGDEKATNPFFKADDDDLQQALGMTGQDPVDVFARVRGLKDQF